MGGIVYLFRHGETFFNRNKMFTGWKDSKLTPKGIADAKLIGEKLASKKIHVAIHTPLSRSRDTLRHALKNHPECTTFLVDERMIERSYGDIAGLKHTTIVKKYGEKQFQSWHRGYSIEHRPPGGECFADVEKRVRKFITWLKKYIKENDVNVAISAHGNSIRLFRKIVENLSIEETTQITIPYDKVYTYDFSKKEY